MKKRITVVLAIEGYTVKMTQDYDEQFNRGDYRYVIERDGEIATAGWGSTRKISEDECRAKFEGFRRWGKADFEAWLQPEESITLTPAEAEAFVTAITEPPHVIAALRELGEIDL